MVAVERLWLAINGVIMEVVSIMRWRCVEVLLGCGCGRGGTSRPVTVDSISQWVINRCAGFIKTEVYYSVNYVFIILLLSMMCVHVCVSVCVRECLCESLYDRSALYAIHTVELSTFCFTYNRTLV